jgi:hypothetical protein
MSEKRVRIFSDFCDSKGLMEGVIKSFGPPPAGWTYVYDNTYTHAIIMNTPMPELLVPPERVVGLAQEPFIGVHTQHHPFLRVSPQFIEYAQKCIGKYRIGAPLPIAPFCEGFGYLFHVSPPPADYIPAQIRVGRPLFSMMVSRKQFAPGHMYRHVLAQQLLKISGFPVHIYGNGCGLLSRKFTLFTDDRIKGGFDSPEVMYREYPFHICIENFQLQHYVSEKIINPLIYGTTPVYLGATQIEDYYGPTIKLTGKLDDDIKILYDIIANPGEFKRLHTPSREKVIQVSSLSANLDTLFE